MNFQRRTLIHLIKDRFSVSMVVDVNISIKKVCVSIYVTNVARNLSSNVASVWKRSLDERPLNRTCLLFIVAFCSYSIHDFAWMAAYHLSVIELFRSKYFVTLNIFRYWFFHLLVWFFHLLVNDRIHSYSNCQRLDEIFLERSDFYLNF